MTIQLTRLFFAAVSSLVLLTPSLTSAQAVPDEVRFAYAGGPRVWVLGKIDGTFDKAFGAKVKWIPFNSGADVLTLFAAKEIDIARFGSSPAAAGIARKLPIEVIGVPEIIATSERLIARTGINSLKELEGKTVAYPANSTAQYAFEVAVRLAKADRGKINGVALKPSEMVAAWKRNDIDAAYVWGPFSHQLEGDGGKEIFATRDLQKDGVLVFNNYVVRKEFAEKYPDIIVKFLRVSQEKIDQYKKDPEGSAQLIAKHLDIPLDTARDTLAGLEYPSLAEQLTPAFIGHEASKPGSRITLSYKGAADFLAQIGEIRKEEVPASYTPFINTTYLQRAAQDQ
jgi:taurine transport system substrate-binding protein